MSSKRSKRATLRDVARLANVSTTVVSYVINNGPRPTAVETRARVLQAIQELDYHPNASAQGLRAQRTYTIGFIANDYYPLDVFVSPYSSSILTSITSHLKAQDHYLLIYPMVIDEDLASLEKLLHSRRLDGVIVRLIQDPPATDRLMEVIVGAGVPCVCIERPCSSHFDVQSVTYDDVQGARAATRYLLERGHRRIAHLQGDHRYATAQARLNGYQQALTDVGLAIDDRLIQGDTWDVRNVAGAMRKLLALPDPPTAVFAASDDLALAALKVVQEEQRRVPDDIAVIGFDDIPAAEQTHPPLTTVRIPLAELGQRAAELVLEIAHGSHQAGSEVLPVQLIARASA